MLAPPIGGVLYSRFGFRGPFIFALTAAFLDFISRLIIMEPKEAMKWGVNPTVRSKSTEGSVVEVPSPVSGATAAKLPGPKTRVDAEDKVDSPSYGSSETSQETTVAGSEQAVDKPLPLLQVIVRLSRSSRALVALLISFVYGY